MTQSIMWINERRPRQERFLRVPDGNLSGDGHFATDFQSLKPLHNSVSETLAAVDGLTIYHGWGDLVATMRAILTYERGNAALLQISIAELDRRIKNASWPHHLISFNRYQ